MNTDNMRKLLCDFAFEQLFIEELGWSNPMARQEVSFSVKDQAFTRCPIAQLAGVMVLEIKSDDGSIPNTKTRGAIHKNISAHHHENLLIFMDEGRTQSLWYWVKRQDCKTFPRDHIYVRGQPGDLFLSKLSAMVFDISEFDEAGDVSLMEVTHRLKQALDIEQVTKKFYNEFQEQHLAFQELIEGIDDERDRRWYASVLLHRLMFIYFLQRKFFLDNGDERYLQNKLAEMRKKGRDLYYEKFLKILFFEGFAKPEDIRGPETNALLGKIKYLNGGLFLRHRVERDWRKISVPDKAFENLYTLFERYSWNLNDTPGGEDNEINPDVLGYIFEKYINQKAFGAYYTRPEITEYLCERTIHRLILDAVNTSGGSSARHFDSIGDLLINLDARLCRLLLNEILPNLRLLDPACGSAAFLVAAMKTLINVYSAVIGKIEFLGHKGLAKWLEDVRKKHKSVNYFIKRSIITDSLFGVDIMEEAIDIAKLRLFLSLVAAANNVDELEPLPNIEFNIMTGNSLIGLLRVDDKDFDKYAQDLATASYFHDYREVLAEKNELVDLYRRATSYAEDLQSLRDGIEEKKQAAIATLNRLLLDQFTGIKYEEATWDDKKNKIGKSKKRPLAEADIQDQKPFHWGYEFDQIINERGGFDAIITNPPWEIFKPNAKEFFEEFSDLVTKKKMSIKEFQKEQAKLLKDSDIRTPWLEYLSGYPHISNFFRSAEQYHNQISIVNGKKAGTDINLYKLFTEQCFNLLREGGYCGMVIPSGIYTDLGAKQLREMLFAQTQVTGLFCIENRKAVFENVDSRFKFIVLTYEKGGKTQTFPAAFMRHDVGELETFPREGAIDISVDLVRRLSPDSLSVMEFKSELDIHIAKKMLKFPLLGEDIPDKWNLRLTREFDMTNDSHLFETEPGKDRLPLYEGKMIWHFDHQYADPQWWVHEREGRSDILGKKKDDSQTLGFEAPRLGFRDITAATNERSLVASMIPAKCFAGNTLVVSSAPTDQRTLLFTVALFDSFVVDWMIRQKITSHCNMFYMYQLPIPRLTENDAAFRPIVERATRLICTTPEFDDLAREIFGGRQSLAAVGVTNPTERAKLRAELDGLIAHLYGLTEDEFAHILTTFPLVSDPVKVAARNAYRDVEKGLIK